LSLEVSIHEGESQESLLRRFQKMVQMSGVLREVKANRHFVPKIETAPASKPKRMPNGGGDRDINHKTE